MKVIYVHGINNDDTDAAEIHQRWSSALCVGLKDVGVDLDPAPMASAVHYGKKLADETDVWVGRSPGVEMSIEPPSEGREIALLYREYQRELGIEDEEVQKFADEEGVEMGDGIHKGWIKAIARAMEKVVGTKGGSFLARWFLPQASAYLEKPGLKDEIDNMVDEQVRRFATPGEELIIVAHSLGTVVMYRLLRSLASDYSIKLFLTLGSPLGIKLVKMHLPGVNRKPEEVLRWVNGSDAEDFVALLPRLDAKTFGDNSIHNIIGIENNDEDKHSIEDYLSNWRVAQTVFIGLNS